MNATLYRYHGIAYTYADLQAAYRRQQDETHRAIDSGDYAAACDITKKDVREYLPQMTVPERSGTTGHKRTLTAPRKCGIIKAIKRYFRRWKQKQEGKTMKIINIKKIMPAPFGFGQITHNPDDYYTDNIKPYLIGYLPAAAEIECDNCTIIVYNAANYYCIKVKIADGLEIIGTRLFANTISPEALCKEAETLLKQIATIQ